MTKSNQLKQYYIRKPNDKTCNCCYLIKPGLYKVICNKCGGIQQHSGFTD